MLGLNCLFSVIVPFHYCGFSFQQCPFPNTDQCPTSGDGCCDVPTCNQVDPSYSCVDSAFNCSGPVLDAICPLGQQCCSNCSVVAQELDGTNTTSYCIPRYGYLYVCRFFVSIFESLHSSMLNMNSINSHNYYSILEPSNNCIFFCFFELLSRAA